jgi:hypothetical protein
VRRAIGILVVVGALMGATFALSVVTAQGQSTAHAKKHAVKRHHATTRHHSPRAAQAATGDTSGENAGEASGEASTESEAGQPGEPANGHADTGANAQHECTGNCVE